MNGIKGLLGLVIIVAMASCSPRNLMSLTVTEPARVTLPPEVKRAGIINRSLPGDKSKTIDKIDQILSAEGKDFDKDGAEKTIEGLADELKLNSRFESVKILDLSYKSPGLGVFPAVMSWEDLDQIVADHDLDIIYTLAFYDTETSVSYTNYPREIVGPLGIKVNAIEHEATALTLIKTGYRMYVPSERYIADEYELNRDLRTVGRGINPMKAAEAILGRREAVMQSSMDLGHIYGQRILARRVRVSRYYYVRGTNNFKIARRRAQTGDWEGAADLWQVEVENRKRKIAGRACYNMAIINEINGDLPAAIDWASTAYTDYRDRLALRYLNTLKRRLAAQDLLEAQKTD